MFRVYVGNLPYAVRDGDLKSFFEDAGCKVTEATVVMMPDGRSKGFGFVSFEDEESFKKATGMSGSDMQGRQVRIDAARPKEDRGDRPMGGDAPKADKADDEKADDMMDEAEKDVDVSDDGDAKEDESDDDNSDEDEDDDSDDDQADEKEDK